MKCNGARVTVETTFGTIRRKGRIICLMPAAVLTRRRCGAFVREFGSFPIHISLVDHFQARTRRGGAMRSLGGNLISVIVKAREILSGSIKCGSLKLLVVSRRRHFNIARGRGVGGLERGVSILALATAPVPEALRVDLVKVHSVDILRRTPVSHVPVRACMVRCGSRVIHRTVRHRLTENKRICCICGEIRGVTSITLHIRGLIPSTEMSCTRKRVGRRRLRSVVCSFVGNSVSILMSAAVVRAKLSVTGTGAVVVRSTSQFKLSRLCRLQKEIKESGQVTCTFLLCRESGVLGRITRGELTTVHRFASLKSKFGVTVHSLRVQNTKGLLKRSRDNRVTTIKCSLCYGVLGRTIDRLGNRGRRTSCAAAVSLSVSMFVPRSCVGGRCRGLSVCGEVTAVRARRRVSSVARRLVSHFKSLPGGMRRLLRVTTLGDLTRSTCVATVRRGKGSCGFVLCRGTGLSPTGVPTLLGGCKGGVAFGTRTIPCFLCRGGKEDKGRGKRGILRVLERVVRDVHRLQLS